MDVLSPMELEQAVQDFERQSRLFQQWLDRMLSGALDKAMQIIVALAILFVGKKLLNLLLRIVDRSMERIGTEITVRKFMKYLLRAAGYGVIVITMLQVVGFETTSLITVIGSAGVALGLALQGSLANFAGGILILVMKPFRVGDYIIEDGHKNEGIVKSIGLVYTHLVTPDNKLIVIPNGNLANNSMTNVTAQEKRRLDIMVGIAYSADLRQAKALLLHVLQTEAAVLKEEEMLAFVSGLDDSAVTMGCRCWVPTADYWPVKWSVTERIKLAFDEAGIEIPFPQVTVHDGMCGICRDGGGTVHDKAVRKDVSK